jgi:hypothetical protein
MAEQQRTQTPPAIRWLANELASTKGELERVDRELAFLKARRKQLLGVLKALSSVSEQMSVAQLPVVVPVVKAHNARYGGRGQFRAWLKQALQAAAPQALDTLNLTTMAVKAFGLSFETEQARRRFVRNTLGRALRAMLDEGEVERLHDYRGMAYKAGVWRWARDTSLSLEQLTVQAQEPEAWR